MKTIGKYLILAVVVYLMIRCDADTETPQPESTVVSGNINVFPTSITAGETVTISWSDLVNVKTLMINNTPISISDGSKTYTLTTTTTFSINLIGTNDKVIEKSAVVNVVEPPVVVPTKLDTMLYLISLAPYVKGKVEKEVNGVWDEQTRTELEAREVETFSKDFIYSIYDPLGIGLSGTGTYTFSSDLTTITFAGQTYTIITLDKDKLVLGSWYYSLDPVTKTWVKSSRCRRTYVHK